MSKHTPGPWKYAPTDSIQQHVFAGDYAKEGEPDLIIDVFSSVAGFDAQLIAAAPDLLNELQRLSTEVRGILNGFELELREVLGNTNYMVLKHKLTDAAAAIKKAEGAE
jgi:hypothetical protein